MSKKTVTLIVAVVALTLGFAMVSYANVPPPPVNQTAGIDDGIFNNLVADDCRFCHDLGNGPVDGVCSVSGTACSVDQNDPQSTCPNGETCLPILAKNRHHLLVDGLIVEGSLLNNTDTMPPPNWTIDADNNGIDDTNYACENCHPDDPNTPIIEFPITRNCLVCHVQQPGVGSVHHIAESSPAQDQICTVCHGDLVDDTGDGHEIPEYDASLITPKTSQGNGPANPNFLVVNRGACDYCHATGNASCVAPDETRYGVCITDADCNPGDPCVHDPEMPGTDDASGAMVYGNSVTHHNTGLGNFGAPPASQNCVWCHPDPDVILVGKCSLTGTACTSEAQCAAGETCNFVEEIRTCENCHGYEALHNIAFDSDDPGGDLVVGGENPWFSHVGNAQDCEGCHRGYGAAAAPGSGPVTPVIDNTDATNMIAGTDTVITLDGKAFTNTSEGTTYTSNAVMTAADGSSVTLTPSAITQSSMTVTIPGSTAVGSYELRAVKAGSESNPVVINVIPGVEIADVRCRGNKKRGYTLTITGAGFGDAPPAGSGDYLNVVLNGVVLDSTITWEDTKITAGVSRCPSTSLVNVNALFGSDTAQARTGKIKKPKK
jgi:hypothetical protein